MKKIIATGLILGCTLLAGCSGKNVKLDQLSTDVQTLNQKVDNLQSDMGQLQQQAADARGEAARANERLDNQKEIVRYRK